MRRSSVRLAIVISVAIPLLVARAHGASVPFNPGEGIYASGDWKYQLLVLNQGTKDERSMGKLSFKGKEVIGKPDHRIEGEIGEFIWSPYFSQSPHCGWRRIDPMKKYARWQKAKIDENGNGPVYFTVPIDLRVR